MLLEVAATGIVEATRLATCRRHMAEELREISSQSSGSWPRLLSVDSTT